MLEIVHIISSQSLLTRVWCTLYSTYLILFQYITSNDSKAFNLNLFLKSSINPCTKYFFDSSTFIYIILIDGITYIECKQFYENLHISLLSVSSTLFVDVNWLKLFVLFILTENPWTTICIYYVNLSQTFYLHVSYI